MEAVTDGVNNLNIGGDSHKKNRIKVSYTKKPLFFYVNQEKLQRYMQQHDEVELSALGMVSSMHKRWIPPSEESFEDTSDYMN